MTIEELTKFCSDDPGRLNIAQAWTRDGYTYATNGHIIVRVPAIAGVPEIPAAPDAAKRFANAGRPRKWMPVPKMAMPADVPCRWCDGTKTQPDYSGIPVANTKFAKRYLALIQGWEIAPNGQKAAWIRHGDATGLLMPVRA